MESPPPSEDRAPLLNASYHDETPRDSLQGSATYDGAGDVEDLQVHSHSDSTNAQYFTAKHSWMEPIAKRIPFRVKAASSAAVNWARGPDPPRQWAIQPVFPRLQAVPLDLLDRWCPKTIQKIWLLMAFYSFWLLTFSLFLKKSAVALDIPGYGAPQVLWCGSSLWEPRASLNGNNRRPFENSTFAFRCPAGCASLIMQEFYHFGNQSIRYTSRLIGGPTDPSHSVETAIYRADSWICPAAIHSGFLDNRRGGCGVVSVVGASSDYPALKQHGVRSYSFNSTFPKSFTFLPGTQSKCQDLRWPLLAVSLAFTVMLSLFTTSPAVFFWSLFVGLFFHVALVSDPPNMFDFWELLSTAVRGFLPACFAASVIYRYCVKHTLSGLRAQFEKTVLWLGAAWVGALNNYTFDRIPISRLTPSDIRDQPGAIPALITIVLAIFGIALGQAWAFRVEGRLPRYLGLYGVMGASLLLLLAVPNEHLRIHHYILALLLLPGTAMQTRPSLVYQGLLLGLFVNGIARWDFASLLQTAGQLDHSGHLGSLIPHMAPPVLGALAKNITFPLNATYPRDYFGLSVLVNDVERFRGYEDFGPDHFTWLRQRPGEDEYFRFAYLRAGDAPADYSKAGVWEGDGTWRPPPVEGGKGKRPHQ